MYTCGNGEIVVKCIKFGFINLKFRSTLFKGLQVWAEPIKL